MKDYAIIVKYEDGLEAFHSYYKYAKTAIRKAKEYNDCEFLIYEYYVIQLSTHKILYHK